MSQKFWLKLWLLATVENILMRDNWQLAAIARCQLEGRANWLSELILPPRDADKIAQERRVVRKGSAATIIRANWRRSDKEEVQAAGE